MTKIKSKNGSKIVPHKINIVSFFEKIMKTRKGILSVFVAILLVASIFSLPLVYASHTNNDADNGDSGTNLRDSEAPRGDPALFGNGAVSVTEAEIEEKTGLDVSESDFVISSNEEESSAIVISISGHGKNVKFSILERRSVLSVNSNGVKSVETRTNYHGKISVSNGAVYNVKGSDLEDLSILRTGDSGFQGGGNGAVGVVTDDSGNEAPITDDSDNRATNARAPDEPSRLPGPTNSQGSSTIGVANLDVSNKELTISLKEGSVDVYKLDKIERRPVRQDNTNVAGRGASVANSKPSILERIFGSDNVEENNVASAGAGANEAIGATSDTTTQTEKPSLFQRFKNFFFRKR